MDNRSLLARDSWRQVWTIRKLFSYLRENSKYEKIDERGKFSSKAT